MVGLVTRKVYLKPQSYSSGVTISAEFLVSYSYFYTPLLSFVCPRSSIFL
jgi:hypothetical protein